MKADEGRGINGQKKLLEYQATMDYGRMMEYLNLMVERYPFLSFSYLGESIMGRGIPVLTLGEGDSAALYVGVHRAKEWITSVLLLRWLNEACEWYASGGKLFHYNAGYLFSKKRLIVVPMLNPDGVDYHLNGVSSGNVLCERLSAMNGGSSDFSSWQANARGVDLSHNYSIGFDTQKIREANAGILGGAPEGFAGESSESEPEVGALCNYIRYHRDIRLVVDLQTSGETICYSSGGRTAPRSQTIANSLREFSGYRMEEEEACGTLLDFCIGERNLPAVTLRCGKKEAPIPLSEAFYLYTELRRTFFLSLTLI